MNKKNLSWEDLEKDIASDNINKAEELFSWAEEVDVDLLSEEVETVSLNKEYKIPDDELAYEIYLSLPNTFQFRGKEWFKDQWTLHCQKHNINLNDLGLMKQIKEEIQENMNKSAMEIDDELFNDLLSLQSTPSEDKEEIEVQIIKEEKKEEDTLQTILKEIQSLKDRVSLLEDENRLLKEINTALKKEKIQKSTNTLSDTITPQEIIASYNTTPKKRRGRPAGYKTSENTKAKQRAARLNKLQQKENNETQSHTPSHSTIPIRTHSMEETTLLKGRTHISHSQTGKEEHQPRGTTQRNPQSNENNLRLETHRRKRKDKLQ